MSRDSVTRHMLQKATGAQWAFISFPGGGERIAALLGEAGHERVERRLVPDDEAAIGEAVGDLLRADGILISSQGRGTFVAGAGASDALEGKWGFLHAYAPSADGAKAVDALGRRSVVGAGRAPRTGERPRHRGRRGSPASRRGAHACVGLGSPCDAVRRERDMLAERMGRISADRSAITLQAATLGPPGNAGRALRFHTGSTLSERHAPTCHSRSQP